MTTALRKSFGLLGMIATTTLFPAILVGTLSIVPFVPAIVQPTFMIPALSINLFIFLFFGCIFFYQE